jgi:hypothetical protein
MRPGPIEIEIEELVLHGLPTVDADVFAEGVRSRLEADLLADTSGFAPRAAERVVAPPFSAHDLGGETLAVNVAASIKGALTA